MPSSGSTASSRVGRSVVAGGAGGTPATSWHRLGGELDRSALEPERARNTLGVALDTPITRGLVATIAPKT